MNNSFKDQKYTQDAESGLDILIALIKQQEFTVNNYGIHKKLLFSVSQKHYCTLL